MPARFEQIAGWVNEFGWTSGVELGVFDGATHFYLLEHCPELHLIGIDLWAASTEIEGPTKSGERCFCEYCSATRAARKSGVTNIQQTVEERSAREPRSTLLNCHTAHAPDLLTEKVDFVFVDGDHSREGVTSDIAAWKGKILRGGRLIGHDWNMLSVREAVKISLPQNKIWTGDDHLWWTDL